MLKPNLTRGWRQRAMHSKMLIITLCKLSTELALGKEIFPPGMREP